MDRKELLKRWVLSYTEPSLFYVPWKGNDTTYNVEFRRYANIKEHSQYPMSSYRYKCYAIHDEIYYPQETTVYYIYDEHGYYYDENCHKEKYHKSKLTANTIKLPKGRYFYKEMQSLYGCKLIENVIPFIVTGDNTIVVTHHEANMLRVDYHVELETIQRNKVIDTYVTENNISRQQNYGEHLYTVEDIRDIQYIQVDPDLPIIKIDRIANYKNDYSKNVQLNVNYNISSYINDWFLSEKANADYLLPNEPEDYNLTYVETWKNEKSQSQWFYYSYTINNNEYHYDKTSSSGSRYIRNLAYYGKQDGEQHNKNTNTDLFWISHPNENNPYLRYETQTYTSSGFHGRTTQTEVVGKNTMTWKMQYTTFFVKRIHTYINNVGEEIITEEEYPSKVENEEKLLDNFNEISIFSQLLGILANAANENISLGTVYLYKEKGNNLTCYEHIGTTKEYLEKRRVENGSDIENKDADAMYVGALIAYEKRQDDE